MLTRPAERSAPDADRGWIGTYVVVLICQFLNFALFQLAYPFIPLFLVGLGESENSAIAWTGFGQAVGSICLMLANPVWGALGDRYGRKSMVVRAMIGGAITLTLMGLATQAWQLFAARVLQGLFGGSSVALITLAALTLPRVRLSMGMGLMQTAQFLGISLGPLMGTVLVGLVGFRGAFFASAAIMAGLTVLTLVGVREMPSAIPRADAQRLSFLTRLAFVSRVPPLRGILLATLSYQVTYSVSLTLLPLHLYSMVGAEEAPRAVGIVLASSALGAALGAVVLGWAAGRVGPAPIAIAAFLGTGILLVPQGWLGSPIELAVCRFAADFCGGGILPALRTLLADEAGRHETTSSSMGAIYGLSQSAIAGGSALGAVVSTAIAAPLGISSTFLFAGALAIVTGVLSWLGQGAAPQWRRPSPAR